MYHLFFSPCADFVFFLFMQVAYPGDLAVNLSTLHNLWVQTSSNVESFAGKCLNHELWILFRQNFTGTPSVWTHEFSHDEIRILDVFLRAAHTTNIYPTICKNIPLCEGNFSARWRCFPESVIATNKLDLNLHSLCKLRSDMKARKWRRTRKQTLKITYLHYKFPRKKPFNPHSFFIT